MRNADALVCVILQRFHIRVPVLISPFVVNHEYRNVTRLTFGLDTQYASAVRTGPDWRGLGQVDGQFCETFHFLRLHEGVFLERLVDLQGGQARG